MLTPLCDLLTEMLAPGVSFKLRLVEAVVPGEEGG